MKNQTMTRIVAGLSLMTLAGASTLAGAASYGTSAGYTPKDLVDLLVPAGNGINVINTSQTFVGPYGLTVANATQSGVRAWNDPIGIGTSPNTPNFKTTTGEFVGGSSINPGPASTTGRTGIPFDTGVLLTTGFLGASQGTTASPNNSDATSKQWGAGGSGLLDLTVPQPINPITSLPYPTQDASTLSFQFTLDPDVQAFKFQYAFASDEYNEYVGSTYNDAFAFVLTDLNTSVSINLAKIGADPVSVNSVNAGNPDNLALPKNPAFYANNQFVATAGGSPFLIEYDGIAGGYGALPLFAIAGVNPLHTYQIDIVIADVGDDRYDSAVFLDAGSFVKTEIPPTVPEPSTYVGALALAGLVARRLRRK